MIFKKIILLSGILFVAACSKPVPLSYTLETISSPQKVSFSIDSLTIDAGELGLFHYPIFSTAKINETNYFFGWNNKVNRLEIFDLDNQLLTKTVEYAMEGPMGLEEVKGLKAVSFDSIFFMSKTYILLADTSSVFKDWGINERNVFDGFNSVEHNLTTEESFNLEYDPKNSKLYTRLHFPLYGWCDSKKKYYRENIIAELDLSKNKFSEIAFDYPAQYHDNHYGFRDIPNVTYSGNRILNINFSISSHNYQFDLENNRESVHGGESENTDNLARPLEMDACPDIEARMKHNLRNVKFLQLYHDPYRGLYYRFHWGNVSEQKADGKYSSYRDKKLYLSVFDQNLAKIDEYEIDRRHGASWCFVNEHGLYVLKPRGEENLLGFNVFKFEKKRL